MLYTYNIKKYEKYFEITHAKFIALDGAFVKNGYVLINESLITVVICYHIAFILSTTNMGCA